MYPFVFLGPLLALLAGQAEPSEAAIEGQAPDTQEPAPAAQKPAPAVQEPPAPARRPARADRPPPAAASQEQATQTRERTVRDPPATARGTVPTEPERAQVARAALAFLDALLAGDASALAAASTERFSFDGEVRTGRDDVRRAWRTILTGRDAEQQAVLLDLELLPVADAISRLGPPPARLAPLAGARGTWVGIANVSSRPVVLFLTREGNRWAVAGME